MPKFIFLLITICALPAFAGSAPLALHDRVPGELIVKLRPGAQATALFGNGVEEIRAISGAPGFVKVRLTNDSLTAAFLSASATLPGVEYAEPNFLYRALGRPSAELVPNDPLFEQQWALRNIGQTVGGMAGKPGADIGAAKAWDTTKGSRRVVVAVIDTGVDYTHSELAANILVNAGEIPGNGLDDDSNGFVDDVYGWNFADHTNLPLDANGHGTHVAGIIGANGNNAEGVAGVAWEVSLLPVQFLSASGSGSLENAIAAITYAVKRGAHVMNNSWGGGGFSQALYDTILAARDKGVLFVAAAGGDGGDSDTSPSFPSGYQLDNVVAVAASTSRDTLAVHSSYGKRTVHIAAPGHNILSTIPGNSYAMYSGSSFSAGYFSGAAALLLSAAPELTLLELKQRLLNSRDYVPGFSRKVSTGGRLNVNNAILALYPPSPEPTDADWHDVELTAAPESSHPYEANSKQEWLVEGPANARYMRLVFTRVDLEPGYDHLRLIDANGDEADVVTGRGENTFSYFVPGNRIVLRLTSDSTEHRWGFSVGKVQAAF